MMVRNKRLERLNTAKRLLEVNPEATAAEIVQQVRAREKRRLDTFKSLAQLLPNLRRP